VPDILDRLRAALADSYRIERELSLDDALRITREVADGFTWSSSRS